MVVDLVRRATDERVVDVLLEKGALTRAEISATAGVSKPTASESVRRLTELGIVQEAGRQEGGRGRSGTYCRIARGAGVALAAHAGPGAVVAEAVDARGEVLARHEVPVGSTVTAQSLLNVLQQAMAALEQHLGRKIVDRVLSVADPVDRLAVRLVHLKGSPFVLGDADLAGILGPGGVADNDIAWAALAELDAGGANGDSFLYVYLGEGLGAALVDGGRLVSGRRGLAGEIAYVVTVGPDGRALRLLDAFGALGLWRAGTTSLDVAAVRAGLADERGPAIVAALAVALASCVSLLDPQRVVLGGPWSEVAGLRADLSRALVARSPHSVEVDSSAVVADAPLAGARRHARDLARAALLRLLE